jgi:hypothetical protein
MGVKQLWLWRYTDDFGKRRVTRYRLSDADAKATLRNPELVEGSLLTVTPVGSTSDFQRSLSKSVPDGSEKPPGTSSS